MGVAGCGKSTVAGMLATELGAALIEGDELPPAGEPGKDAQRRCRCWTATASRGSTAWARCIASSPRQRRDLPARRSSEVTATGCARPNLTCASSIMEIAGRGGTAGWARATGHLFPPSLVVSQFASLEAPAGEAGVLLLPRPSASGRAGQHESWAGLAVNLSGQTRMRVNSVLQNFDLTGRTALDHRLELRHRPCTRASAWPARARGSC